MTKLKLGDVIEIRTSKGLAYAQYTHEHERYGSLIRVFGQTFMSTPGNDALANFVKGSPQFLCFFPASTASKRKINMPPMDARITSKAYGQ